DRREDGRHQVALSTGRRLQTVHGVEPALGGALGSDPTDALDLATLTFRVDAMQRWRRNLVVAEAVDPDDDLVARLDGPLDAVGRLLDLALLEAALDRGQRAAHRLDL